MMRCLGLLTLLITSVLTATVFTAETTTAVTGSSCTLTVFNTPPFSGKRTAIVKSFTGKGSMQVPGKDKWVTVFEGMEISEENTLFTHPKSTVIVKFDDESELTVKPGSVLHFKQMQQKAENKFTQLTVWVGGLRAKVKPLKSADNFYVRTPVSVCAVRGTDFSVDVGQNNAVTTKVYTGQVAVQSPDDPTKEVVLSDGQQVTVSPDKDFPLKAGNVTTEKEAVAPAGKKTEDTAKSKDIKAAPQQDNELVAPTAIPGSQQQATSKPSASNSGKPFSLDGQFGTETLTDQDGNKMTFSKLKLTPEFKFWKIGVGLDIVLYFNDKGEIRGTDWDFNEMKDALDKIWYLSWGSKGESIYAYVGGFRNLTMGHGLIMSNYSNMLQYPSVRKGGAELDLNLGYIGFETMVSDVNRAEIYGGRMYVRPLWGTGLPIIKKLGIGVSAFTDQNPDSDTVYVTSGNMIVPVSVTTTGDQVNVYGADIDLPVITSPIMSMVVYADAALMDVGEKYVLVDNVRDGGTGSAAGVAGTILSLVNYRAEYRKTESNFVPSYFNAFYDVDRITKATTMQKMTDAVAIKEGPYAEVNMSIMGQINARLSYEDYTYDPENIYPWVHGEINVDPQLLMNKLTIAFYYDKRNASTWEDLITVKGQNTIIRTEIGYPFSSNIFLVVITKQTFDAQGNPFNSTSVETRVKF
ncbi:MAG: FecR domain-containing protein [Elusimicrobiota bacterium]